MGFVTRELPLLANLNVLQNIALIKQYHANLDTEMAQSIALALLNRLQIGSIAFKRTLQLTEYEIFLVKFLRAIMLADAEIILDRPFVQAREDLKPEYLYQHLRALENDYRLCRIFDYEWNKENYLLFST